jgi:nitroreductase
MDTFLAIASKRDQREYADREIPEEVVRRILEAGRIAGSASNRQPWRFIALESAEAREQVAATVYTPPNILGSKLAVAIVVQGNRGFDAGRAAQNMMLAAWNDGVTSCPNGMPDAGKAGEVLGLGEDEHVLNVISFGYPARERNPEERLVEEWLSRAKRKPFDELVERRYRLHRGLPVFAAALLQASGFCSRLTGPRPCAASPRQDRRSWSAPCPVG